ncbi:hypothetical protein Aduo_018003 [Ancylostoma duodenale]
MSMMVSCFEPMSTPIVGHSLVDDGAACEETSNPTMLMMVLCFEPMSTPTVGHSLPDDGTESEECQIQRCR